MDEHFLYIRMRKGQMVTERHKKRDVEWVFEQVITTLYGGRKSSSATINTSIYTHLMVMSSTGANKEQMR